MNTSYKTQKTLSISLLAGVLLFSSSLLLAEKHNHDEIDHKGSVDHAESEHSEKGHEVDEDHGNEEHEGHDDHAGEDHKETANHAESEHQEHDDHDDEGHNKQKSGNDDGHGHGGKEEGTADVELSVEQRKKAGIKTLLLKKQSINNQISALSEVKLNQYRTIKVSPPLTTRVEKRHVRLGDKVEKGRKLVTLHTISTPDMTANLSADKLSRTDINASITMTIAELEASIAEAQGDLAATNATWNRLRSLGKEAVSGKRYTAAKIARDQAAAKLKALKRSRAKIKTLGKPKATPPPFAKKHYQLRAEQAGMVIKDDFVLGQIVNPEDVLFEISDMDQLWVEANIKPRDVSKIAIGSKASIMVDGKTLRGKVIFIGRVLNEKTRTLPVRIEVNTKGASLYPGQFVKTSISSKTTHAAIAIPAESVLRSPDGDWMLFVEEAPGRFVPKEVEIVQNMGDTVVVSGIDAGTTIVSKGAFFVQSEMAKSGFEVHNH